MPDAVDASRFRMRPAQGGSMGEFYAQAEHFLVDEIPLGASGRPQLANAMKKRATSQA